MAERPVTLLEKLNQVLETLAIRLGQGPAGTGPIGGSSSIPASGAGSVPSFLDPIKRLLERMANALDKVLGRKGGVDAEREHPTPFQQAKDTQQPQKAPTAKPSGGVPIWELGTTPHGGPQQAGGPGDVWTPISNFHQELDEVAGKPDPKVVQQAKAGQMGVSPNDFKGWLAGGGGAGTAAAGGGQAAMAAGGHPIVMAAMAAGEEIKKKIKALEKVPQRLADVARREGPGDVAGGVFGIGEDVGKAIGGSAGEAVTKVSSFAKTIAESVDNLRRFDREILNASFRFGEFSASMSAVEAQQEARDIQLGMQKGDAQAGSANKLAEAMSELNETVMPFENAFANFRNEVLAEMTKGVTELVKLSKVLDVMKVILEFIGRKAEDDADDPALTDVTERLYSDGDKYALPKRFQE